MSVILRKGIELLKHMRIFRYPNPVKPLSSPLYSTEALNRNIHNLLRSNQNLSNSILLRYKSKQSKSKKNEFDDEEDSIVLEDDYSLSRDSRVIKFSTTSMRTDGILKSGLGVARNKIEKYFYESKIRVNGRKVLKKSAPVREGDEIDVVKAISPKNPDHINVARVEILNVMAKEDSISVTVRRFNNLLIENYETDPYKGQTEEDN